MSPSADELTGLLRACDFIAIFKALGNKLKTDAKVSATLAKLFLSLEAFAAGCSSGDRIAKVVDMAGLEGDELKVTNPPCLKVAFEQRRRLLASSNPSVDVPLTGEQLEEVQDHFWRWYHLSFGPEDDSTDGLVSCLVC